MGGSVAGPMGLCVYKGGDHVSGLLPYIAKWLAVRSNRIRALQGCIDRYVRQETTYVVSTLIHTQAYRPSDTPNLQ